ncbi:MAG: hypothetical protein EOM06_12535 [Sphingobacteriia bacterium]|nr:hypothetical protein [Sphingobacteriia bacterium]
MLKIFEIEDRPLLEAIKSIFDKKTKDQTLHLPDKIISELMESKKNYDNGNYTDNEVMEKEAEECLKKK